MPRVAIIYYSATGTTAELARAVEDGAARTATVSRLQITADDIVGGRFRNEAILEAADAADGLVLGSPTYMGGPAAQFKAFADASSDRWEEQRWAGKVAAGFTTGAYPNGDQSHTLTYLAVLASQHGMLWCNLDIAGSRDLNRLGSQLGLVAQAVEGKLPESDLETARHLGNRLARVAARLKDRADASA